MPSPLYLCIHLRDFAALALTVPWDRELLPTLAAQKTHAEGGAPAFGKYEAEGAPRSEGAPHLPSFGRCGTREPVAVLDGDPPLERVFSLNSAARSLGLAPGMSRLQAEAFAATLLRRELRQEELAFAALMRCAGRLSPRIEIVASPQEARCGATLLLDASGCGRLLGSPSQIAAAAHRALCELLCETPANEGVPLLPSSGKSGACEELSVIVAHNACVALLAARGLAGAIAIASGREAATLASLPIAVLDPDAEQAQTLEAWGIRTLGQLAALPTRALAARLGQAGLRMQSQARGEANYLLVPAAEPADAPLCASIELEQPVELLEPLLFLLNQMLEQVLARAAERALAIASLELCLVFEKTAEADGCPTRAASFAAKVGEQPVSIATASPFEGAAAATEDRRTIRPALPERDRLTLLKLMQLELDAHPPASAVVALRITAHPARPQTAQQGLFAAQAPAPGQLAILLARLRKLVGEGRAGSPELLDSRAPEAFGMTRFEPGISEKVSSSSNNVDEKSSTKALTQPSPALRLLRPPPAVAVELRHGAPAAVRYEGRRRIVETSSGPWRTSGAWWIHPSWCREEWEIFLRDCSQDGESEINGIEPATPPQHAPPCCLRLAHDTANGGWYVIGIYD